MEKCSHCENIVPQQKLKVFTEYFFSTFMTHYKLYQYVFTKPRDDNTQHKELTVETIQNPEQFSSGKPVNIWEYEQKLNELDEAAERLQLQRESELNSAKVEKEEHLRKSAEAVDNLEPPLSKEVILLTDLHN